MSRGAVTAPEVAAWLDTLEARNRSIVECLRRLAAGRTGICEIVYHGALGYGTSESGFDRIIYAASSRHHVTLGFFYGGSLDDPKGLLRGEGKRMRHVRLTSVTEATDPDLVQLVQRALTDGPSQVRHLHEERRAARNRRTEA